MQPTASAIAVTDYINSENGLAQAGFRIITIYHVDVVAYIASIYLRDWILPRTLSRWWERLRGGVLGRAAPTILKLVFEQQRASLRWSEQVIVPSSDMKAIMLGCYPETPADRIEILPWGCPPLSVPSENSSDRSSAREGAVVNFLDQSVTAHPSAHPMPEQAFNPPSSPLESLLHSSSATASEPSRAPCQHSYGRPGLRVTSDTRDETATALRAEYGIEPDAQILLCLSRISPEKGQDFLLNAMIEWELSRSFPSRPIWLFICGAAAFMNGRRYEKRLRNLAARLTRVRVVFPGYVAGARKSAFLSLAHLYLFPSSHESYGLTLVEALASGLPAICRDHSGARQILSSEFGIIVAGTGSNARLGFRNAMERVLMDDSLRSSMSRSASEWASRRPFSQSAARLAALLQESD